jgi:hypothetical protein
VPEGSVPEGPVPGGPVPGEAESGEAESGVSMLERRVCMLLLPVLLLFMAVVVSLLNPDNPCPDDNDDVYLNRNTTKKLYRPAKINKGYRYNRAA